MGMQTLHLNKKIGKKRILSVLSLIGLIFTGSLLSIILFLPPLIWWCYLLLSKIRGSNFYYEPVVYEITERLWYIFSTYDEWFWPKGYRIISSGLLIITILTICLNILVIKKIRKTFNTKRGKLYIISIIGIIIGGVSAIFYIWYLLFLPPLSYYM